MRNGKRSLAGWLSHKRELTGPDGTGAVLARRVHPLQETEHVLSKSVKSRARGGAEEYAPVRVVELFWELREQGRTEDIDLVLLWLRQQAQRVRGGKMPDLMELMSAEQEADGMDDPLQLRLAGGNWSVADETAMRLMEQAAASERLARRIQRERRERRLQ